MNTPFASMYITANTTVQNASAAGTVLAPSTSSWVVDPTSKHGEASAVGSVATGKITCVPGIYEVQVQASIEGPLTSDSNTSGDTTGKITLALAVGGTIVTGSKSKGQDVTDGVTTFLAVTKIVEITKAQLDAATNYIQALVLGGDASGNDVLVSEARMVVKRLS